MSRLACDRTATEHPRHHALSPCRPTSQNTAVPGMADISVSMTFLPSSIKTSMQTSMNIQILTGFYRYCYQYNCLPKTDVCITIQMLFKQNVSVILYVITF